MNRTYILDTNILMRHPDAIWGFDDREVVVPATVLEELDRIKDDKRNPDKAAAARAAIRQLDRVTDLSKKSGEKISTGVRINGGRGVFRYENDNIDASVLPQGWDIARADNQILSVCKKLGGILVTEDGNMRNKAQDIDIENQPYRNAQIDIDEKYTGRYSEPLLISDENMKILHGQEGVLAVAFAGIDDSSFVQNEYFVLIDGDTGEGDYARYVKDENRSYFVRTNYLSSVCRVTPRNAGQYFALDALLSPDIPLVILVGEAGTAKTFLSVTAAMDMLHSRYDGILATRNNAEFDKEIGALPGDEQDKVGPLLRGLTDNLRTYLKIQGTAADDIEMSVEDYLETSIHIESLGFMRGRSITDTFIILDEAQNATPQQIFGVVTRLGKGSKLVICGDPDQIDRTSLTKETCGLTFVSAAMKGSPYCAQIRFTAEECERSDLAKDAAERMGRLLQY